MNNALALALLLCALQAGGCVAVKPWERDLLARPDMQAQDDPHLRDAGRGLGVELTPI